MMDNLFGKPYRDLYPLKEDDRIREIAAKCRELAPGATAVLVDDEPAKVLRYLRKLRAAGLEVRDEGPGPVPRVRTLLARVRPV